MPMISHAASFDWNALLLPNTTHLRLAQVLLLTSYRTLALDYNIHRFLPCACVCVS